MLRIHHLILAAVVPCFLVMLPPSADAAKRGAGMGVGQCWIEGTPHPAGPGESISSCCLEDGCWICSATWNDCTWDPKVGTKAAVRGTVGVAPGGGTLEPTRSPRKNAAGQVGSGVKSK
jgi:hypothetical protein